MPADAMTRNTSAGDRSSGTPRCSTRSAEPPVVDEAARPPCLTTVSPVEAATIAAMVEMFTAPVPSPPVPTMSTKVAGMAIGLACRRSASASPAISAEVSPLARKAIRNPETCAEVASPRTSSSIAQKVSSAERSRPLSSAVMIPDQVRSAVRNVVAIGNPLGAGPTRRGWFRHHIGRLIEAAGWYAWKEWAA